MADREPKIKSLAKAMRILECFKRSPELGVTEISEELGLYKSNTYDILSTFEALGYVGQSQKNGKYHLGNKILELSHVITTRMGFRQTVYPHMLELARKTGETVYLAVPDGTDVMYLDAAYPGNAYVTRNMLGERAQMYCTGIGKAMLCLMDEKMWRRVLDQPRTKFTDQTIMDPDAFWMDLKRSRERGYAVDNMEHEYGVKCVGAGVINESGQVVAGISISGPSPRFGDETIERHAALLREMTEKIRIYF